MNFNIETILRLISAGHSVVQAIMALVDDAKEVLSSEDAAQIEAALKELQLTNDEDFARIMEKLEAAKGVQPQV